MFSNMEIGGSFGLTFFSDARLASLSNRLGNNKVNDLVGRISHIIRGRLTKRPESGPNPNLLYSQRNQNTNVFSDRAAAAKYIERASLHRPYTPQTLTSHYCSVF